MFNFQFDDSVTNQAKNVLEKDMGSKDLEETNDVGRDI